MAQRAFKDLVLDSSAIIAIILGEAGAEELKSKISASDIVFVGATTLLETTLVLQARLQDRAQQTVDRFVEDLGCKVLDFTHAHYLTARGAYLQYGKGRHKAALNFGDCMSYSFAKVAAMPLLFVGGDFVFTDIEAA
ncbi:MAG: type II toxin-antitoxin system VapC family toxin [Fimbriimonas sp.]